MPEKEESVLVVGLDSEWSVDPDAQHLGHNDCRQTAIVQIAYNNNIWIFQLNEHLCSGHFPSQLITFLKNPRILKVGRNIKLDLRNLQEESGVMEPFAGDINIAHLAEQKGIVKNTQTGLADLCAKVLKVHLDKDPATRVSPDWASDELSSDQLQYAALNAWASLRVYEELEKIQIPGAIISFTSGQDIFLYQDDTNIIAQGHISPHSDYQSFEGINVTPTQILVEVTKVFVPGAIISTHRKQALSDFGPCPFTVVALHFRIKTHVSGFGGLDTTTDETSSGAVSVTGSAGNLNTTFLRESEGGSNEADFDSETEAAEQEGQTFEWLVLDFCDILASANADGSEDGDLDPESVQKCDEILEELKKVPWPTDHRSGVLKDIFHVFQMIWIPKSHGLHITCAWILRDAIFLPDPEDMRLIVSFLAHQSPPMTWKECLRKNSGFIKKHCKFTVPPPEVLYDLVAKLFRTYRPLKDAQTGLPLFNANTWKTAKNILILIRSGHSLPINGVSPRHTSNRLTAFVYYHNITVRTYNSTGQRYKGHFDLWLTNKRQTLLNSEVIHTYVPTSHPVTGWINGDLYIPTTEVFGILPIPTSIQVSSAITSFNEVDPPKKFQYLARKQGTRFTVLTVHTAEEKQLFSDCMLNEPLFTAAPKSEPVWLDFVKIWNNRADGETIFYKLIEHLKTYYLMWKSTMNAKHTIIATYNTQKPINKLI
ncbi:hypothetical protein EDD85DRAFT_944545 [Armillaria nabsnona]|nr:hypothetical protein EDD85DRAFT_944545 [Armillaria nabsnona]